MTRYLLREGWRESFGWSDLRMPIDPAPSLADFPAALANHQALEHEDAEDFLNADGTWGPGNVGAEGGSGIAFGYSSDDLAAVVIANKATHARAKWYDYEHWIRQIRYAIAEAEMRVDNIHAVRRVLEYANHARADWSETGRVSLGTPWDIPENWNQYHRMALEKPGQGLFINGRAAGWILCGEAMALKLQPGRSRAFARMALDTLRLAAMPGTGQIIADDGGGAHVAPVQYTFHAAILGQGTLGLCHRLKLEIPLWLREWFASIKALPVMDYYGYPSPPAFTYTIDGKLVVEKGPIQHADPGCAFWSSNAIAAMKIDGDQGWKEEAKRFGATNTSDQLNRRLSMLLRGAA